jgi:hypothetical protein
MLALNQFGSLRTTADIHGQPDAPFRPEFAASRSLLDYTWHTRYSQQRQALQNDVVRRMLRVGDPPPLEPWVVLTAGCMGAGKTHTMTLLGDHGLFPLERFVRVDLDLIRAQLPETQAFMRADPLQAGRRTQQESGSIAEVVTEEALQRGLHVWIDSSLKDAEWWASELRRIRRAHPRHRLAIVHVMAGWKAVQEREAQRGLQTGRHIPHGVLRAAFEQVPSSVERLRPLVHEIVEVANDGAQPRLGADVDAHAFLRLCRSIGACHVPDAHAGSSFLSDWFEPLRAPAVGSMVGSECSGDELPPELPP